MKVKIPLYIDRLRNDGEQTISETLPPSFLEVEEGDLTFNKEMTVTGKAYLANDHLIIQLSIKLYPIQPCIICNEKLESMIEITDHTHTEEIDGIRGHIYDLSPLIRETALLQVPQFFECNKGSCPERTALKNYL